MGFFVLVSICKSQVFDRARQTWGNDPTEKGYVSLIGYEKVMNPLQVPISWTKDCNCYCVYMLDCFSSDFIYSYIKLL